MYLFIVDSLTLVCLFARMYILRSHIRLVFHSLLCENAEGIFSINQISSLFLSEAYSMSRGNRKLKENSKPSLNISCTQDSDTEATNGLYVTLMFNRNAQNGMKYFTTAICRFVVVQNYTLWYTLSTTIY